MSRQRRGGKGKQYRSAASTSKFIGSEQQREQPGFDEKRFGAAAAAGGGAGVEDDEGTALARMRERDLRGEEEDLLDAKFGYERFTEGADRLGWMFNLRTTSIKEPETGVELSAIDMYFVQEDGKTFKASYIHKPYFLIQVQLKGDTRLEEVVQHLLKIFPEQLHSVTKLPKEDLELPNHLSGLQRMYMQLSFRNINDLMAVRKRLKPKVDANKKQIAARDAYDNPDLQADESDAIVGGGGGNGSSGATAATAGSRKKGTQRDSLLDMIVDLREYDVPYDQRVCIDTGYRVGAWYEVKIVTGTPGVTLHKRVDMLDRPQLKILAFDIETTKLPLKFPDAKIDSIMMISLMVDGAGYLIVNRDIVGADIADFEYNPKPDYPGPFTCINVEGERDKPNSGEKKTIETFFDLIKKTKPQVIVSYNGDNFDFPFMYKRAWTHGLDMRATIGLWPADKSGTEYKGRFCVHLDAFAWVQRDSYLPQGSHGLKAVTRSKLAYDPLELDPEDMLPFASEKPQVLASYSVSDAVATYYLYLKYVHLFIFSLCNIIPMPPSDVLRKGSGTLCEALLMVKAFDGNIVCPNKKLQQFTQFYNGHLLESETYIGGHVECLESGVFRSDLPCKFKLNQETLAHLQRDVDKILHYVLESENKVKVDTVANYNEIKDAILAKLSALHATPQVEITPLIYHLDVGAMYPNIILTNRLQPMAIVDLATCAACDFNTPENKCQRVMQWSWRGKYFPISRNEYEVVKSQLESETVRENDGKKPAYKQSGDSKDTKSSSTPAAAAATGGGASRGGFNARYGKFGGGGGGGGAPMEIKIQQFGDLTEEEQANKIKARVKTYSQKVYKKMTVEKVEEREATVCQRENPFYVNTVREFRDRRYTYKKMQKDWKAKEAEAKTAVDQATAKAMVLIADSLQLAHKCILNSFYGYVMRKGARWSSIEMAGIVTKTGAEIIKDAKDLVEGVGRVLELDTDGIWCVIPSSFPENYEFKTKPEYVCSLHSRVTRDLTLRIDCTSAKGATKKIPISFPCAMLNHGVEERYSNHQYQMLDDEKKRTYKYTSECSIAFEVDGPYRAMVLPSSKEEGKNIKKRYAVFNMNGTLAELKGFEIKRRGELQLIKNFQAQVFAAFLHGKTLQECYNEVGAVANRWLDVLYTEGANLDTSDLFDYIGESKNMSASLSEYGVQKSTAITCARRLGEFLGAEMVKDKGLQCKFIIVTKPDGAPVSERALPTAIFSAEPAIMKSFVRKWMKDPSMTDFDVRTILDWKYYIGRLGSAIQKIITIPAAMQKIPNPVTRIEHPDWLMKKLRERDDPFQQRKIKSFFTAAAMSDAPAAGVDMEDMMSESQAAIKSPFRRASATVKRRKVVVGDQKSSASSSAAAASAPIEESDPIEDADSPSTAASDLMSDGRSDKEEKRVVAAPSSHSLDSKHSPSGKRGSKSVTISVGAAAAAAVGSAAGGALSVLGRKSNAKEKEKVPDPVTNFDAWHEYQKSRWRAIRQKRKWERAMLTNPSAAAAMAGAPSHGPSLSEAGGSLHAFARAGVTNLRSNYWQIVQVQEDDMIAGLFHLWVLIGSSMQRVTVQVPRVIYINHKASGVVENEIQLIDGADWNTPRKASVRRVEKTLPRARVARHLYEVTKDEQSFQAKFGKAIQHQYLNNPSVEGVYETQLPLLFKLMTEVGCVCKYTPPAAAAKVRGAAVVVDSKQPIMMQQLQMKNAVECPYLVQTPINRIFLYHSYFEKRGIFGLFIEEPRQALVVTVNASAAELKLNWESLFAHAKAQASDDTRQQFDSPFFLPWEKKSITERRVANTREAYKELSRFLTEFHTLNAGRKPTVVLAQHPQDISTLYKKLPVLKSSFPVVTLKHHADDNGAALYPALGWLSGVANRMIAHYLNTESWWTQTLELCAYGHVPIGNLDVDQPLFVSDVLFARALRHAGHVLWCSPSGKPDLGGQEEDENFFAEHQQNPEVISSGCFRQVCVSFDVKNMAVNAVLQQQFIEELEGATSAVPVATAAQHHEFENKDSAVMLGGSQVQLDDAVACASSFKVLKSMLLCWTSDARKFGNLEADNLICHFYRWLRSPASKLFDPALHRMVHKMMTKVFKQLIARFRGLGATVVYASFNRAIICTHKFSAMQAYIYMNSILQIVKARPLFQLMDIEANDFYQTLLFMDSANWGAIQVQPGAEPGTVTDPEVLSNWNIAEFLPRMCHSAFTVVVGEYLLKPYEEGVRIGIDKPFATAPPPAKDGDVKMGGSDVKGMPTSKTGAAAAEQYENVDQKMARIGTFIDHLLKHTLQQKLLTITSELIVQVTTAENNGEVVPSDFFPELPGSHLRLTNPALEFIKFVCHVLAIDSSRLSGSSGGSTESSAVTLSGNTSKVVSVIRQNLLQLVQVKPFSAEAQFVNPCATVVVPDVICAYCNQCRDLDICRDPQIIEGEWRCPPPCRQLYDKSSIESSLVQSVLTRHVAYQVQDLQCTTCQKIKATNLAVGCSCSGAYSTRVTPAQYMHSLRVYASIARYHNMSWLEQTLTTITQGEVQPFIPHLTAARYMQQHPQLSAAHFAVAAPPTADTAAAAAIAAPSPAEDEPTNNSDQENKTPPKPSSSAAAASSSDSAPAGPSIAAQFFAKKLTISTAKAAAAKKKKGKSKLRAVGSDDDDDDDDVNVDDLSPVSRAVHNDKLKRREAKLRGAAAAAMGDGDDD